MNGARARSTMMQTAWLRLVPFGLAACVFLLIGSLYAAGHIALYHNILLDVGIDAQEFPFLDTEAILSPVRCRRLGVDIFQVNPCDPLGRLFDYSPLWLAAARLPVSTAWTAPVGLSFDLLFLFSLLLLPTTRSLQEALAVGLAAISPSAAFALERGNCELLIFVLCAVAAALFWRKARVSRIGYCFVLLAALIKYYPITLMALAIRERPRVFFAIAAIAVCVLAGFVWSAGQDLPRSVAYIPLAGSYFSFMFGAPTFPGGLMDVLYGVTPHIDAPYGAAPQAVVRSLETFLLLATLGIGAFLATRASTRLSLAALMENERSFLLVGAMLLVSSFFAAQNMPYRAMSLIMVLPAIISLRRSSRSFYPYRLAALAVLLLLWSQAWLMWVGTIASKLNAEWVFFAAWLVREVLWWWIITLLLAAIISLLLAPVVEKAAMAASRFSAAGGFSPSTRRP